MRCQGPLPREACQSAAARQEDEEASTSGASANGAAPGADGAGGGSGGAGAGGAFSADMLEQFFRDPEMQKLLYKYLPEPMQNPQTFEWMLSNPQYRKQLEDIMQQQARAPAPSRTSAGSACMRVGLLSAGVP